MIKTITLTCSNPECDTAFERRISKLRNSKSGLYFCCIACKNTSSRLDSNCPEIRPSHYGTAGTGQYLHRSLGPRYCKGCGSEVFSNRSYCNVSCRSLATYNNYIVSWKSGNEKGYDSNGCIVPHIKRYIRDLYGDMYGNYKNNIESNLTLLCPNCHSLTENYGSLNIGNGRRSR